ncbi:hypothetical protein BI347_07540 [Chromobacterium sphagni]|uniref:Transposase IS4-like domain-containing protein n=1 Tax=Chromobacterium sphagni TaxID=1903179 RepID=A0A1S1X1V7_9NEIS|nr:hypothetical protein BI347_07540 [Chromobacterium sphagni]
MQLADEPAATATLDGADDIQGCYAEPVDRGIMPVIPPRKNAKPWKSKITGSEVRNAAIAVCKRLRRLIWKHWSGYHRRSLAETKMHGFKRPCSRVMARTFDRQVAELQVRAALLNHFTTLGPPKAVAVAAMG